MPKPAPSSELRVLSAAPDLTVIGAWASAPRARAPPVAAHDRGLRPRRQAIHRLSARSASAARPRPATSRRCSRRTCAPFSPPRRANSIDARSLQRALSALRSLAKYLPSAPAPAAASAFSALGGHSESRAATASVRCAPRMRARSRTPRDPRRRGPRALGSRARRRGAGALLWRGPAHQRGAFNHPWRRAGRRRRRNSRHRQGRQDALGARDPGGAGGNWSSSGAVSVDGLKPEGPLFVGARAAAHCRRASCNWRWSGCAGRSACPTAPRRTRCAIPSPRICSRGGRPRNDPGIARPRLALDHPGLHRRRQRPAHRRLQVGASAGVKPRLLLSTTSDASFKKAARQSRGSKSMSGKRIVFTGGTGKAGRHAVPHLVAHGYSVLNVDLKPLDLASVSARC